MRKRPLNFNAKREIFNKNAKTHVKSLIENGAKVILDVNKNATGKTTRNLDFFVESEKSVAFVVHNHLHGLEKEKELNQYYPKFNEYVLLMRFEKVCPLFKETDENGEVIVDEGGEDVLKIELEEIANIYRQAGIPADEIHKKMDETFEQCPYTTRRNKFQKLGVKKAILSQHMLKALEKNNHVFDYLIFDEVDNLFGFSQVLTEGKIDEYKIEFEPSDPEPLKYNLGNNKHIIVKLKEIKKKLRQDVNNEYDNLARLFRNLEASEIEQHPQFERMLWLTEQKKITDNIYVMEGKDKIQRKIEYKLLPMLTDILVALTNPSQATLDGDGNPISVSLKVDVEIKEILPTIIISSARMRENIYMEKQLDIAFELARFKSESEIAKEQISFLRDRLYKYPENPSVNDFPSPEDVKPIMAYIYDPKTSTSNRKLKNADYFADNLRALINGWSIFKKKSYLNVKVDSKHRVRLITMKDFERQLFEKGKNLDNISGRGTHKIIKFFMGQSEFIENRAFGGKSAGSNPNSNIAYILLFGDWLNGEYTSFFQYLYYYGQQYSKYTKSGRQGFELNRLTPKPVEEDILQIIGLEFKEYILVSRYERPVFVISHLIASNFKYFRELFSKFNIDLQMVNV